MLKYKRCTVPEAKLILKQNNFDCTKTIWKPFFLGKNKTKYIFCLVWSSSLLDHSKIIGNLNINLMDL